MRRTPGGFIDALHACSGAVAGITKRVSPRTCAQLRVIALLSTRDLRSARRAWREVVQIDPGLDNTTAPSLEQAHPTARNGVLANRLLR